jgi:maltose/moltooligosaccharide transporter
VSLQERGFAYYRIWVLGFGFLGISLLWSVYNDFVPVLLQAGRPDFSRGAGVEGFALAPAATGLIMGLDNLAAIFILPWIGGISDRTRTRWGRRKPYIAAGAPVAAVAFACVPFLLNQPLGVFMGAIAVTLLAMDLFRTPVVALMPDLTPPALRSPANGIINFMGGLGAASATVAGGLLFGVSPVAPFLLGAGGMLVAQLILLATVREPEQPEAPEEEPPGLVASFVTVVRDRDRSALALLAAICAWFLGQSALDTWFTSFAIDRFGLDAGQAALLKSHFTFAVLGSALPCGVLGARLGRRRGILLGLAVFALALAAAFFAPGPSAIRLPLVAAGFGWMLVVVNSLPLVLDFAPPGREGTYTGLYYLASQTAAFLGPIVSGSVFQALGNDYRLLLVYSPVALAAAFALMLSVRR